MVVATTVTKNVYSGDGSNKTFPFTFRVGAASDIVLFSTVIATGVTTTISASDYSTVVNGNLVGGTVTYPLGPAAAVASTVKITVARARPYVQPVQVENQTRFFPSVLADGLDNLAMQVQQLNELISRAVKNNISETTEVTYEDITAQVAAAAAYAAIAEGYIVGTGVLLAANNLSDLTDIPAARTLLDIPDPATIATAAQGDLADAISAVMVGQVAFYAMNTAPTGTLKANGALVSRTTYARLFTAIGTTWGVGDGSTTFALPDLRGEFVRGWDDARGVDAGRAFGSAQAAAFASHTHTGATATAGAHTHTILTGRNEGGGARIKEDFTFNNNDSETTSSAGDHSHSLTIDATGGAETRPRNIALLAVIFF